MGGQVWKITLLLIRWARRGIMGAFYYSVATGTGVQTVVKVEVMPQGRNTLVRVSVEKRGSAPLYSSDVKLSRKIAKLLEEEFAESTD